MNSDSEPSDLDEVKETRSAGEGISSNRSEISQLEAELSFPQRAGPREKIGRYQLIEPLGKGGFGFVYLAFDPELSRNVAIKVPRWDRQLKQSAIDRFLHEGRMLAQVNHSSIVQVFNAEIDGGIPFVVMEYIEGETLSTRIKREGVLPIDVVLKLLLKLAEALKAAHQEGLVHRDFKPGNVIVREDGAIFLVDFGLALHDDLLPIELESKATSGTPGYMSPEQIRGENHLISGQTDIWAFGITMYQLLTGRLPFKSDDRAKLTRAVVYAQPRPLRQLNDRVPKQLERICLRCLEKLMSERYSSMVDVIEELTAVESELMSDDTTTYLERGGQTKRLVVGGAELGDQSNGSDDVRSNSPFDPSRSGGSHSNISRSQMALVPRGLRSFDQNDAEFFLRLLPGPTDRHGLPESIRFWLSRIDPTRQVEDPSVGIIYGPSGCGKSSFVRAGLIPLLPANVIPVYVDCTTENLAARITHRIRQKLPGLPGEIALPELLRAIRQGDFLRDGDKLLLVLDQFEQWLSAANDYQDDEITVALRQCDSRRLQTLFLIRDEFWLSASQLMRGLGQRIEEGRNALALPLFDEKHARQVLVAYGRAYGALPQSELGTLSLQQKKFVNAAINSLANRGRVICVHLAVFAETAKADSWTYTEFKSRGGLDGIGREFIAGIFQNPERPSYIQKSSSECWAILRQLLPEVRLPGAGLEDGTLKGQPVPYLELMKSAGLVGERAKFTELMRFLEFDANLISRAASSLGQAAVDDERELIETDRDGLAYELTHDFLVRPIRSWGSAKQSETIVGRADGLLARLSGNWSITRDDRFLPSVLDWGRMALFASKNEKQIQSEFWQRSTRQASRRLAALAVIVVTLLLGALWLSRNESDAQAKRFCQYFQACDPVEQDQAFSDLVPFLSASEEFLRESLESDSVRARVRSAVALIEIDANDRQAEAVLVEGLAVCEADLAPLIEDALVDIRQGNSQLVERLESAYDELSDETRRARLAILASRLGNPALLQDCLKLRTDPNQRTVAILELREFVPRGHVFAGDQMALRQLARNDDELASGICTAIGLTNFGQTPLASRSDCVGFADEIYRLHHGGGAHVAAMHALKQLAVDLPAAVPSSASNWQEVSLEWPENSGEVHKLLFVKIPAGTYEFEFSTGPIDGLSPERLELAKKVSLYSGKVEEPYWISSFEVPRSLIRAFKDQISAESTENASEPQSSRLFQRGDGLSYPMLCEFVDWLNKRKLESPLGSFANLKIAIPTRDQQELAVRAGSRGEAFFGRSEFDQYFIGNDRERLAQERRFFPPNGFGVCDALNDRHVAGDGEWIRSPSQELPVVFLGSRASEFNSVQGAVSQAVRLVLEKK